MEVLNCGLGVIFIQHYALSGTATSRIPIRRRPYGARRIIYYFSYKLNVSEISIFIVNNIIHRHEWKNQYLISILCYNLHLILTTSHIHNTQCQNKTIWMKIGDTFSNDYGDRDLFLCIIGLLKRSLELSPDDVTMQDNCRKLSNKLRTNL